MSTLGASVHQRISAHTHTRAHYSYTLTHTHAQGLSLAHEGSTIYLSRPPGSGPVSFLWLFLIIYIPSKLIAFHQWLLFFRVFL